MVRPTKMFKMEGLLEPLFANSNLTVKDFRDSHRRQGHGMVSANSQSGVFGCLSWECGENGK